MPMRQLPTDDTGMYYPNQMPEQMAGGGSMWDSISNWAGDNKDLLLAGAGAFAKYNRQKADNRAQDYINQAAAKWSGFSPNLLNLVKPIEAPNAVELAQQALIGGPVFWNDISKIYEAREAAKRGDQSKFEEMADREAAREAKRMGLNAWGMK